MADAAWSIAGELRESTFEVPVEDLRAMGGMREPGLDEDHVQRLVETGGQWPAVLLWEAHGLVLDGVHRLAAAKRLGMATIWASPFVGTSEEAYAEAVRCNVAHGLPLTLAERTNAAYRVLRASPQWSDGRISSVCGLSAKTVARLRRKASTHGDITRSDVRVGKDGRARPVEPRTVRARIAEAISEHPEDSLRSIAAQVGASPETVRSVRRDIGPAVQTETQAGPASLPCTLSLVTQQREKVEWSQDRSLSSCPSSAGFLQWFESTEVADEWTDYVSAVPLSRVYVIADEARRRARIWRDFAETLEGRVRLKPS